jgi:hypothetical protein
MIAANRDGDRLLRCERVVSAPLRPIASERTKFARATPNVSPAARAAAAISAARFATPSRLT